MSEGSAFARRTLFLFTTRCKLRELAPTQVPQVATRSERVGQMGLMRLHVHRSSTGDTQRGTRPTACRPLRSGRSTAVQCQIGLACGA
jgi:hypothetical protein